MTVQAPLLSGLSLAGRLDPVDVLARLAAIRDDQQRRWRNGDRLPAEDYLRLIPGLADDPSLALDVIYSEVLLRRQLGEAIAEAEYLQRFPDRADSLRILFVGYRGLHDTGEPQTVAEQQTASERDVAWESYELLEKLGEGGMGVVWKARHVPLNRLVALKMLRQDGPADPERFRGEAEAVARLHHPNIVQLYDFGTHEGAPYLTQEFVPGGSLADRLRRGTLAPRDAAALVEALARGVQHAHDRHILHRDLKPGNILIADCGLRSADSSEQSAIRNPQSAIPKIADFGLAKRLDELHPVTRTGSVLGTPSYMSPEQASGDVKHIGPACDVYSLGAILYECLTGRPPFRGGCLFETLRQVRLENPIPPRELAPHVPAELEAICLKCLEKQPARRYASARLLALELRRFLDPRPPRRHGWGWLLAVLLLVGVAAGLAWRPAPSQPHDPERPLQRESKELLPDYGKRLTAVRALTARRPLGWRQTVLDELAVFEQANPQQRRPQEERGLKLSALAGIDVEPPRFVLNDLDATCLAFSADGRILAVALEETEAVRLLDVNGRLIQALTAPLQGDSICCLTFADNGQTLAAATRAGKVYCWHLDDNVTAPQCAFALQAGPVVGLSFSPDMQFLYAASSGEKGVYRWGVQSQRPTPTLRVETERPATGLTTWAQDRVVWLGGGELRLLNHDTLTPGMKESLRGAELTGPLVNFLGSTAIAPQAVRSLLACVEGNAVALVAPGGLYRAGRLPRSGLGGLHAAPPDILQLSRSGALLLSASSQAADRHVKLWEVASGRLLLEWSPSAQGRLTAALDPDGRFVAVGAGRTVRLHPISDARLQSFRVVQEGEISGFDLNDEGEIVQTALAHRNAHFSGHNRDLSWYTSDGKFKHVGLLRATVPYDLDRRCVVAHPQGAGMLYLFGATSINTNSRNWDQDRVGVATVPADCLATDPDGKRVWANANLTGVHSWKWGTTERTSGWEAGGRIHCLTAGRTLILAGDDKGQLHFLQPENGQPASTPLQLGTRVVTAAALFPNEKLALAGTEDGAVFLIDVPGRAVRQRLQEHSQAVTWLAVRADGERLASAGRDGLVHVHQVENDSANLLFTLPFDAPVAVLRFHPDRQHLVILLERERGLRFWNLERLESELGDRKKRTLTLSAHLTSTERNRGSTREK